MCVQVTDAGDIIYRIPTDSRTRLLVQNAQLRTEAAVRATAAALVYVARSAFGGAVNLSSM
jgi:hypothetical protein